MGARGPLTRRAQISAVEPIERAPKAPSTLKKPGLKAWREAWREASWLTATDATDVERLARLIDEEAELLDLIGSTGRLTTGQRGELIEHPYVRQLRAVESAIAKLKTGLGLGPMARARLGIAVAKAAQAQNHVEELMAKYRAAIDVEDVKE